MDNLQFHYKIKHDSYLKGLSLDLIMDISYSSNFCLFDFLLNKNLKIFQNYRNIEFYTS